MSKGFSLIEILVVVGLVGLISILAFSGLNNSINFNLKFNEKSESLNKMAFFNEILKYSDNLILTKHKKSNLKNIVQQYLLATLI